MEEIKDLIVVKQLPIIEENLKKISEEIDKKVELANSLACTEGTVKDVKKARAELSKQFKGLETQRKDVKEKVTKPYDDFEEVYKKYISDKFKEADRILKEKIDAVEDELKNQKKEEVKAYFDEMCVKEKIDFVTFEQTKTNITLTASMKSLKENINNFFKNIVKDLSLIETQEHKEEMLIEYKKSLEVERSIASVIERYKELEKIHREKEEKKEQELTDEVMLNKIESLSTPKVENVTNDTEGTQSGTQTEILEGAFKVVTPFKECLKEIVEVTKKYEETKIINLKKDGDVYHE